MAMGGNEVTCTNSGNPQRHCLPFGFVGSAEGFGQSHLCIGKTNNSAVNQRTATFGKNQAENSTAMLESWYLRREQGTAVVNVVFGKVNPDGKLEVTLPSH
jgi:beta-glucosidase